MSHGITANGCQLCHSVRVEVAATSWCKTSSAWQILSFASLLSLVAVENRDLPTRRWNMSDLRLATRINHSWPIYRIRPSYKQWRCLKFGHASFSYFFEASSCAQRSAQVRCTKPMQIACKHSHLHLKHLKHYISNSRLVGLKWLEVSNFRPCY